MSKGGKFAKKSTSNVQRKVLITLIVILSVLLAVLIGGVIYFDSLLSGLARPDSDSTLSSSDYAALMGDEQGVDVGDASVETMPEQLDIITDSSQMIGKSENVINILLIGQDTRHENQKGLADSMILCSVNKQTKTLVVSSFLRDMYVQIQSDRGGFYFQRINTTYPVGGIDMVYRTLEQNFGIDVDYYVEIDFSGFKSIVDVFGGVDIELTKAEANYLNTSRAIGNSTWKLTEGVNHLTGEQALSYARIRKIDDDFKRTNRQRAVISALFDEVRDIDLKELNDLIKAVVPYVTTDMSNGDITKLAVEMLQILPDMKLTSQHIPAGDSVSDGYYYYANKGTTDEPMYVIMPHLEKNRQLLRDTIGIQ